MRALIAYMDRTGFGPTEVADTLKVDRTLIWRWSQGYRVPNRENVKRIAKLTNLPLAALL